MIEAMACGTPVIAFENGSVPEVLENGVTGAIVHNEEEAIQAVSRIGDFDRKRIRAEFDRRFTAQRMAQNYLKLYAHLGRKRRLPVAAGVKAYPEEFLTQSLVTCRNAAVATQRESVPNPAIADSGLGILQ